MSRIFITCNTKLWQQPQTICPTSSVVSKRIKIVPTYQPNRILVHKPPGLRLVIAHQVVMQPRFFIIILVLQSKRLMHILVNLLVLFQATPGGVFAVPQKIAVDVGHLFRYADLIVMEIGEVLFAVFGVVKDLRQRFVAVLVSVDIGIAAFVGVLLQ